MYKHLFSCSKNEKFIRKILEWQETLDDDDDDDDGNVVGCDNADGKEMADTIQKKWKKQIV